MTEWWHRGTWLGKRFHTEEHIVAGKGDGLVIRSRTVEAMPEETAMENLGAIEGSPWAPSGVLRDVLPDVPRPILSRDEPPFVPAEERPVPRNMKNPARHSQEVRIHARLCQMQETIAQRVFTSKLRTLAGL